MKKIKEKKRILNKYKYDDYNINKLLNNKSNKKTNSDKKKT